MRFSRRAWGWGGCRARSGTQRIVDGGRCVDAPSTMGCVQRGVTTTNDAASAAGASGAPIDRAARVPLDTAPSAGAARASAARASVEPLEAATAASNPRAPLGRAGTPGAGAAGARPPLAGAVGDASPPAPHDLVAAGDVQALLCGRPRPNRGRCLTPRSSYATGGALVANA